MKKILIASFTYILIVGVIGVWIYKTSSVNITYITYTTRYTPTGMYIFDTNNYFKGLSKVFQSIAGVKFLDIPELPTLHWSDTIQGLKSVANVLILDINSILCAINILIAPFKLVIYVINVCMALLGVRTDLVIPQMQLIYNLNLSYINYI